MEIRPLGEVLAELDKKTPPRPPVPLSQWMQLMVFDSAEECNHARLSFMQSAVENERKQPTSFDAIATVSRFKASQCVASDDPRLRP